jgi:hypothetical protein
MGRRPWRFIGTPAPSSPGPSIIPASFIRPRSVTFDGTYLWTSAVGAASPENHIIQKVDPRLATPAVIGVVDMSAYSKGGQGIGAGNPAPVAVNIRQVRAYGGYVFACIQSGINSNLGQAYGFCVIIDSASAAVVGHVRFLGATNRSSDAASVTFDGAGNFFVGVSDNNTVTGSISKFDIAAVVTADPAYGTPIISAAVPSGRIENLTYGAGFIWAVHGSWSGVGIMTRIDPAALTSVDYTLSGPLANRGMTNVMFKFGSVWAPSELGQTLNMLRFDPTTFPSAPTVLTEITATAFLFSNGTDIGADGAYMWATNGTNSLYRYSTGIGTEALVSTIVSPDTTDHFAELSYDGTNMWTVTRGGAAPGLVRISTGVGTEAFTYELLNGGPPMPTTVVAVAPNSGSSAGSRVVTVQVTSSLGATSILFDGVALTAFSVVDSTHVQGTTVAHAVGPVNVIVTNGAGSSSALAGGYTFTTPAVPVVIAVVPTSGTTFAGYQSVTVQVNDSVGITSCDLIASNFAIVDPTHISGITGNHAAGVVDVNVINNIGTGTLTNGYTYVTPPPPAFLSISKSNAFEDGAQRFVPHSVTNPFTSNIQLTFTNQAPATSVTLGGVPLSSLTTGSFSTNDSYADGIPGSHVAGVVNIVATAPTGSFTVVNGFTYVARQTPVNLATLNLNLRLKAGDFVMNDTTYEVATTQDVWYGTASAGTSNLRNARWGFAGSSHRAVTGSTLNGLATVAVTVSETNGGLQVDNKTGARETNQASEVFGAANTGFAWVLAKKSSFEPYPTLSSMFGGTSGQICPSFDFGNADESFATIGTVAAFDLYSTGDYADQGHWCLYQMRWDLGAGTRAWRENNGAWRTSTLTSSVVPSGGGLTIMSRLYATNPDQGTASPQSTNIWIGEIADIGAASVWYNDTQADGIYEAIRTLYTAASLP